MTRYETPAFDPGIAFSWTLRSEEIARCQRQRPRNLGTGRKKLENRTHGEAQVSDRAAAYETPAFEPGIAFSWTLRAAEIARRQSRQPVTSKPASTQLNVLAAA
jgi:hypothetical protein